MGVGAWDDGDAEEPAYGKQGVKAVAGGGSTCCVVGSDGGVQGWRGHPGRPVKQRSDVLLFAGGPPCCGRAQRPPDRPTAALSGSAEQAAGAKDRERVAMTDRTSAGAAPEGQMRAEVDGGPHGEAHGHSKPLACPPTKPLRKVSV